MAGCLLLFAANWFLTEMAEKWQNFRSDHQVAEKGLTVEIDKSSIP
ncbi:MAG: hypothetical protein ACO3XN_02960 [Chthoniobacterales bacterium]